MLSKEQTAVAQHEVKNKDQRPARLVAEYSKQAKGFLESQIAGTMTGQVVPVQETVSDHATAELLKVSSVLQAQRDAGNFYVQQAIETYEKKNRLAKATT